MELFRDTKIDFMKYRGFMVLVSLALVMVSVLTVSVFSPLVIGIDFAGGSQMTVHFRDQPDVEVLRQILAGAGIPDARIQRFGAEVDNEVIIKTPNAEGSDEGSRDLVEGAFDGRFNPEIQGRHDLNRRGVDALTALLVGADPELLRGGDDEEVRAHYRSVAEAIMGIRVRDGLIASWDQIKALPEVTEQTATSLESRVHLGAFHVIGYDNVGPEIGSELRTKGILAVVFSLVGMLVYIWVRFELRFGIGALVALIHDVSITVGFFALMGYEFNLPTIAAFLTVVGYSVNDSVVIFDRVRENMRKSRREPLIVVLNHSLNQTLSRTALTSGTTLLVVGPLFLFGGEVIRGLSFVLLTGVVVGTYSSIFIASPFVLLWETLWGRSRRGSQGGASPASRESRKVASTGRRP